jgi:hypothetical protein
MRDLNQSEPVTAFEKKLAEYRQAHPNVEIGAAIIEVERLNPGLGQTHRQEVLNAVDHHIDTRGIASTHAVSEAPVMFENAVAAAKRANPSLDTASAIQQVAREQPELARARNIALSTPVHGAYTGTMI